MIGKYFYSNLHMPISVFNYVCLNGCHPPEMQGCLHEGRLVKFLNFCLPSRKFDQSFFRVFHLFPFTKQEGQEALNRSPEYTGQKSNI